MPIVIRNLGFASLSVTATPVEGDAETYTVEPGSIQELAVEGTAGKALSVAYSAIETQYEGSAEIQVDVSQVIETDVVEKRLDFTDFEALEYDCAVIIENNGAVDGTLTYQVTGESAATQDIVAGGGFYLPTAVQSDQTIGDVYTAVSFTPDGGEAIVFDTTTVVTTDTVLYVVNN